MDSPVDTDINEGHWTEAQHVAHIMVEFFDGQICNHAAIRNSPVLAAKANDILEALGEFYQEIGRVRP